MFSNVGWGEILVLLVVALVVIGPERLPGLIKELQAILLAVRNAVGQARAQLDNEFGEEIKTIAEPLAELNNVRKMGARGFITKTLLDGDESYLTPLDDAKKDLQGMAQHIKDTTNMRDFSRGLHTNAGVETPGPGSSRDVDVPDTPTHPTGAASELNGTANGAQQPPRQAPSPSSQGPTSAWDDVT